MRSMLGFGLVVPFLLIASLSLGQAKNSPQLIRPDSPILQTGSLTTHDCKGADWSLLDTTEAKNLISDYDFDPFLPVRCTAVDVEWLPSARIVRLSAVSTGVDDFREITLFQASSNSRLWLIPIEKGMVADAETPSNSHHLAAFNDLLRVAQLKITEGNLFAVSNLYQFLVGMPVKSNPHPPKTLKEAVSVNDMAGTIEHGEGFIDFTHREPFGDTWSPEYMVWEFRYATSGKFGLLTDVERKTLKKYQEDQ